MIDEEIERIESVGLRVFWFKTRETGWGKNQKTVTIRDEYSSYDPLVKWEPNKDRHSSPAWIGLEVNTGGASGGNCWGDSAHSYSNDETIREDDVLEKLIELDLLDLDEMSAKEFMDFKKNFVVHMRRTECEYYGNHDDFYMIGVKVCVKNGKLKLRRE